MDLMQPRQRGQIAERIVGMSHVLWIRRQEIEQPLAGGFMVRRDQVPVLRPFRDRALDVALRQEAECMLAAIEEVLRIRHAAHHRANQHQLLDDLGMRQGEVDRHLAAMRAADHRGARHFQLTQHRRQVVGLPVPGDGGRRAAVAAAVIANGMEVPAEFRPDLVPDGRVRAAVMEQHHGLGRRPALLVIELRSIDLDESAWRRGGRRRALRPGLHPGTEHAGQGGRQRRGAGDDPANHAHGHPPSRCCTAARTTVDTEG